MVRGIDNIAICTSVLSESPAFNQALGCSNADLNYQGVMMAAGTVWLLLFASRCTDAQAEGRKLGLSANPLGIDCICLNVIDIDALVRPVARGRGVA
jgi:hypothetical protein